MQLDLFAPSLPEPYPHFKPATPATGPTKKHRKLAGSTRAASGDGIRQKITRYEDLPPVAKGYADALIDSFGCTADSTKWRCVEQHRFTEQALDAIVTECRLFMKKVSRLHPESMAGLLDLICEYDLGRSFYLSRQGTGVGFEEDELGPLGENLAHRAWGFGFSDIAIDDDGNISIE